MFDGRSTLREVSCGAESDVGFVVDRRGFLALSTVTMFGCGPQHESETGERPEMYGLIGRIVALEGRRSELATILIDGVRGMPGCLSYVVACDMADENVLWVTEVWESEASHQESLSLPAVRESIAKGRPLIAEFSDRVVTRPIGGEGPGMG